MVSDIRGLPRAEKRKKIEEVVSEVKMEEWLDKKVGKFSKGMKQRINISAALLSEPVILLLDEPSTGLDPRGMSEVREIVKSLKQKNRLIFMSSHLLNEVSDICDEVAMIDHGKLLVYDKLSNVVSRFSGANGGAIIIDVGLSREIDEQTVSRTISSLPGVVSAEKLEGKNLRLHFSGGIENQEKLLSDLVTMKIGLISFHPSSSALEITYLNLTSSLGFYSFWWGNSITLVVILSGIFFGGDAISGEFQNKTGYFLVGNPLRRSSIYIGKWIAALTASLIIFAIYAAIAV